MIDEIVSAYGNKLTVAVLGVGLALILLLAVLWLIRGRGGPSPFVRGGKNRQPRLQVLDAAAVDARRRLVLVRRDNVEHLIMIGGPTDIVIESGIGDDRHLAALEGAIARDRATIAAAEPEAKIAADPTPARITAATPPRADIAQPVEAARPTEPARPADVFRPAEAARAAEPPRMETRAAEPAMQADPRPTSAAAAPQPTQQPAAAIQPPAPQRVSQPVPSTPPQTRAADTIIVPPPERPVAAQLQPAVTPAAEPIAVRAAPPRSTEPDSKPSEPSLEAAGDMLDAVRQRMMSHPAPPRPAQDSGVELADFIPKVAAPAAAASAPVARPAIANPAAQVAAPAQAGPARPKELGSEFERILETEMARNLQTGELPDDLMERVVPQTPVQPRRDPPAPPITGASADPAMQNEIARIFGEMSVTRDK